MEIVPPKFNPIPFPYHCVLEMTIENITNLGLGIGRHQGWVIMVPHVLIGERIRCRIYRNHSNYSEGDLVEILTPSRHRVTPRCPQFTICGGCQYQHIAYDIQLQLKQQQVKELLQRLAQEIWEVQPTLGTEQIYHYRSKLTPHFSKNAAAIGFLKLGSRSKIVDVPQCCIATHLINERLKTLREEVKAKSFRRGGTLLLRDDGQKVITDPKQIITQYIGGFKFQVYAGEFFQNNPYILEAFTRYITREAQGEGIYNLIDAYCGVGVFAICSSANFDTVTAIEINERAIQLARQNAQHNGVENVRYMVGTAESIFTGTLPEARHTALILDPPRKGCDLAFLEQLVAFAPQKVVYVSCSPDTQARDAKFLLQYHYKINRIQPFDLFPQTRHIENVITFIKCQ
ncbi:MAG: class I SAM-dependent RNA methyltransferase [Puniceicoccales bacterium]|jgi:23S rRNA (uracil1939-C5)-methyltransferase/tRNA (uracil-5-)-methyltransferase|nr:class I SAM-dependent RNA methyltransferase [Puniceicoccales bacterium]